MSTSEESKSAAAIIECTRCGACCEKGGPCFHKEDRNLIEKGVIPAKCLYTIRKGELAKDNVKDCLMTLDSDIIKIKGKDNSWTCIFFDGDHNKCTIYNDRPLECRTLKCWDTQEFEKLYASNRLTRKDLVSTIEGLWGLIEDHQVRCDYRKIQKLIKTMGGKNRNEARQELLEIIHYDAEIRKLVVSNGGLVPEMLDFLFGRPLSQTLENYGVRIQVSGDKILIGSK